MTATPAPPARRAGLRGRGLTPQLFLFAILPLTGLLVLIAFGSLALHSRAMRTLVAEREALTGHAAADTITEQLRNLGLVTAMLAIHDSTASDPTTALADFAPLMGDFLALAIVGDDGEVLATTSPADAWRHAPLAELTSRSLSSGEAAFSEPLSLPAHDEPVVVVAYHGPQGRSAVGAFPPSQLAERVLGDAIPPEGKTHAALVDQAGRLLYSRGTQPAQAELSDYAGLEGALAGQAGVEFADFAGEEHVIAYSPVAPLGWVLMIEEPWEAVDNPLLRQTQAAPLILIPALAFALVAVIFGLRQIVQPLQALEHKAADLGRGQFESIEEPVGGIGEIKSLQRTLVEMAGQLRASRDAIRRYVGALTRAQEEERRRVARELHDQTVQSLIALDQQSQIAQMAVRRGEVEAAERLTEVRRLTAGLLEELRRVIRGLRPIYLDDLGLLAALEILARETEPAAGVSVSFQTDGLPVRLAPEREIAIFRIAQEALSNVTRHAQARHVEMRVEFGHARLTISIRDDGEGFARPSAPADLASAGHYGLLGMQERAELIGATLDIKSSPGGGTKVVLEVPD